MKDKLSLHVFSKLGIKIVYINELNYYFMISDGNDLGLNEGDREISESDFLDLLSSNRPDLLEKFRNIPFRRARMLFDEEEERKKALTSEFILCLHPSRHCNLNCKYCFKDVDYISKEEVSVEIAKKAIDYLVEGIGMKTNKYVVDLAGSGEPTLKFNEIKQIIKYCEEKRTLTGKNIGVMFPTNATCLDDSTLSFIENEHNLLLGVSIDGSQQTNDKNRIYQNGNGTYNDIISNINKLKNKTIGLSVTITPLNTHVDEIFDHLYKIENADCVSMRFVRSFDGSEYDFNNMDIENLMHHYEKLSNNIISKLEQGEFMYLKKIVQGMDYFGFYIKSAIILGFPRHFRCDAGRTRFAVNAEGDIYACTVMMGHKDFYLGNIETGISPQAQEIFWQSTIDNSTECTDCWARHKCGGECYILSQNIHEKFFVPYEKMCELKKGLIELSMALVAYLKEYQYKNYKKLLEFVTFSTNYYYSDSSIFTILKYLEGFDVYISYGEVLSKLKRMNIGVSPTEVLELLQQYLCDTDVYEIESPDDLKDVQFPLIGLLNKGSKKSYEYVLIRGIDDKHIIFESLHPSGLFNIPQDTFFYEMSNIIIARSAE